MPKKKKRSASTPASARRRRRSPEKIIADLQAQIRRVRSQQQAEEVRSSPATKATLAALRRIDQALKIATQEGNPTLQRALSDGRECLAAYLESHGLDVPRPARARRVRPKEGS